MSEHNDNPHDEHISRLYRLGSRGEPPAHLDQKILNEAQRATNRWQWFKPWPSIATAAVLMLSFSLLLKVMEHEPLDRVSLPEEDVLLDAAEPRSQDLESGADVVTEEIEMAPPSPSPAATSNFKAKAKRSRDSSPAKLHKGQSTEVVVEEGPAKAASPPLDYTAPAVPVGGLIGGAIQADEKAAEPLPKLEQRMEAVAESEGCGIALPAAELPASAWQQLYRELLEQEKREQAGCLREIYEQRFGRQLELSQEPAPSVD